MRKFVIIMVVLVIIIAVIAVALFNLDRIVNSRKDFFLSKAETLSGRQIAVEEIGVSVWGGLGIQLDAVTISDDPAFAEGNFIQADQLKVNLALWPLLRKELKVKKVILSRPLITVVRNAGGRFNFDSLGKTGRDQPAQAGAASGGSGGSDEATPTAAGSAYALFVAMANIDDGRVHFIDQTDGTEIYLEKVEFGVKDLRLDRPVDIELSAVLLPEPEAAGRSNLKLEGRVGPVGDPPAPAAAPLELDLSIDPISLGEAGQIPLVAARLPAGFKAEGPVKIVSRLTGTVGDMAVSSSIDLSGSRIQFKDRFNKSDQIPLSLETDLKKTGSEITISRLAARFQNMELTGSGSLTLGEAPRTRLNLTSNAFDLAGWGAMLPQLEKYNLAGPAQLNLLIDGDIRPGSPPSAPGEAPPQVTAPAGEMSVTSTIDLSGAQIQFEDRFNKTGQIPLILETELKRIGNKVAISRLAVRLQDMELTGSGVLTLGEVPRTRLDLKSNSFDLAGWGALLPKLEKYNLAGNAQLNVLIDGDITPGPPPPEPGQAPQKMTAPAGEMSVTGTIDLSGAQIELEDRFKKSGQIPLSLETELKRIGNKVAISRLTARLQNMKLTGSGGLTLGEVPRARLDLKSNSFDLAGWGAMLPKLEKYKPAGKIQLNAVIDGDIKPEALPPMRGRAVLQKASIRMPRSPRPLENLDGKLSFSTQGKELKVDSLMLAGLDGTVTGSGRLDLSQPKPRFMFDSKLRGLDVTRLLVATPAGSTTHFEGRLDMDFLAGGEGAEWADISQNLEGEGFLALLQGTILKFNLAQYILDSLSEVIGQKLAVSNRLKQAYPQVFMARQTSFKKIAGNLSIRNGRMFLPNAEINTGDYTIRGETNMKMNGVLDARGILVLSDRLSADIVKEIQYAGVLKNQAGRLEIPFTISGKLPKVGVKATLDAKKIKDALIQPEVDKLKDKLLDKLFDKKK